MFTSSTSQGESLSSFVVISCPLNLYAPSKEQAVPSRSTWIDSPEPSPLKDKGVVNLLSFAIEKSMFETFLPREPSEVF